MSLETPEVHPTQNAEELDDPLATAVKTEVQHEVHNMLYAKEPVDPTQSDKLVQKHFSGLFITLLVVVVVILLVAIGGIALFGHH